MPCPRPASGLVRLHQLGNRVDVVVDALESTECLFERVTSRRRGHFGPAAGELNLGDVLVAATDADPLAPGAGESDILHGVGCRVDVGTEPWLAVSFVCHASTLLRPSQTGPGAIHGLGRRGPGRLVPRFAVLVAYRSRWTPGVHFGTRAEPGQRFATTTLLSSRNPGGCPPTNGSS